MVEIIDSSFPLCLHPRLDTHKAITFFFYKVTLYQGQLYAPAICFILGITVLLFFLINIMNTHFDRHYSIYHLIPQPTAPGTQYAFTPETEQTPPFTHKTTLSRIDVVGTELENLSIIATFEKEEEPVQLPYVAFHGEKRIKSKNHRDTDKGGLIFIFDKNRILRSSFYIPEIGWNSLAVKLFMRGKHSNAFENVHTVPTYEEGTHPAIQIWKINYPENIKPHPKYLVTE